MRADVSVVIEALKGLADRVAHYPVLFFGAVSATINFFNPNLSTAGNLMVTAWITFLQTLFTASRKGLEEAKTAARNETIAEVSALDGIVVPPVAPPVPLDPDDVAADDLLVPPPLPWDRPEPDQP